MFAAQEGVPLAVIDAAAVQFGMPMGPVELADVVGQDHQVVKHAEGGIGKQVADDRFERGRKRRVRAGGITSIDRTMAVSSGWMTIVGERETTTPAVVTTRSTSITLERMSITTSILVSVRVKPRANRGIGILTMAVEGD